MAYRWKRACFCITIIAAIIFFYNLPVEKKPPHPPTLQQRRSHHRAIEPVIPHHPHAHKAFRDESSNVVTFSHLLLDNENFIHLYKPKQTHQRDLLALILIRTSAEDIDMRDSHRQAVSSVYLSYLNVRRIFVMGRLPFNSERGQNLATVSKEYALYNDILQGNFADTPMNSVYKHTMGLHWAVQLEHRNVKFIVQAEVDTVLDIHALCKHLHYLSGEPNIRKRYVLAGKELVSERATPELMGTRYQPGTAHSPTTEPYPHYLSRAFYITNAFTVRRLLHRAHIERHRMLALDDIWLTGILRAQLDIPLRRLNDWFAPDPELMRCCAKDLREERLRCPYAVAERADGDLIVEFTKAARTCAGTRRRCAIRSESESLENTCEMAFLLSLNGTASIANVTEDLVEQLQSL